MKSYSLKGEVALKLDISNSYDKIVILRKKSGSSKNGGTCETILLYVIFPTVQNTLFRKLKGW